MKDDAEFDRDADALADTLGVREGRATRRKWAIAVATTIAVAVVTVLIVWNLVSTPGDSQAGPLPTVASGTPSAPQRPTASASADGGPSSPPASPEPTGPGRVEPTPGERESLPPVAIGEVVPLVDGPEIEVSSIDKVQGEATLPGEVSGPAVKVTIAVKNLTSDALDLSTAVVTLYYGSSGLQANPVSKPSGTAFPATVPPDGTASGAFVFELPETERSDVRIEVDLALARPLVVFVGAVN